MVVAAILLAAMTPFIPVLAPGDAIPRFALVDQNARAFTLADLRGNAVVISFLFTSCGDARACPLVAAKLGSMQTHLGTAPIRLVALTLDPDHDTPERMRAFGAAFGADASRWKLATGAPAAIETLDARFGMTTLVARSSASFVHDEAVVILDRQGRVARIISGNSWQATDVLALARGYAGAPVDVAMDLRLRLDDLAERCGAAAAEIGPLAAIAIFTATLAAIGYLLWRAFASPATVRRRR